MNGKQQVMKSHAEPSSMKVIVIGSASSIYFLLRVEKVAARMADTIPSRTPNCISRSMLLTTNIIPGTMSNPRPTSTGLIAFLSIKGSKIAVKKEAVARAINAMEALLYLMAAKNVIQCSATRIPMPKRIN